MSDCPHYIPPYRGRRYVMVSRKPDGGYKAHFYSDKLDSLIERGPEVLQKTGCMVIIYEWYKMGIHPALWRDLSASRLRQIQEPPLGWDDEWDGPWYGDGGRFATPWTKAETQTVWRPE